PEAEQIDTLPRALWHGGESDEACVRRLLEAHHRWTGSLRARELLQQWDSARGRFVKVFPHEYRRALGDLAARRETAQQLERASSAAQ
ncbi:glutamate synthase, large subunit, partial [mine drainage metagenome]